MWTGTATIYHFFTLLTFPALAIGLTVALRRRSVLGWSIVVLAAWEPLVAALFWGRREAAAQAATARGNPR